MNVLRRLGTSVKEWWNVTWMPDLHSRRDRARWAETQSLADVAHLTAEWLRGAIDSQPGYWGRVDVDEDLAPGLTAALVALNETGYLTSDSQAGYDGPGDGQESSAHWTQLAWVTGYVTDPTLLARLRQVAADNELEFYSVEAGSELPTRVVTWRNGHAFTDGTGARNLPELADDWTGYGVCGQSAVADIQSARQVVIVDPTPGRNTMWAALRTAVEEVPA